MALMALTEAEVDRVVLGDWSKTRLGRHSARQTTRSGRRKASRFSLFLLKLAQLEAIDWPAWSRTLEAFCPRRMIAAIATIAISATSNAYSTRLAPSSERTRLSIFVQRRSMSYPPNYQVIHGGYFDNNSWRTMGQATNSSNCRMVVGIPDGRRSTGWH